jgi:hypothetical protein
VKSELENRDITEPYTELRGCRVCDFESDDESNFSSDEETDDEDVFRACPPRNPSMDTLPDEKRRTYSKHSSGPCDTVDVDCIQTAQGLVLTNLMIDESIDEHCDSITTF